MLLGGSAQQPYTEEDPPLVNPPEGDLGGRDPLQEPLD